MPAGDPVPLATDDPVVSHELVEAAQPEPLESTPSMVTLAFDAGLEGANEPAASSPRLEPEPIFVDALAAEPQPVHAAVEFGVMEESGLPFQSVQSEGEVVEPESDSEETASDTEAIEQILQPEEVAVETSAVFQEPLSQEARSDSIPMPELPDAATTDPEPVGEQILESEEESVHASAVPPEPVAELTASDLEPIQQIQLAEEAAVATSAVLAEPLSQEISSDQEPFESIQSPELSEATPTDPELVDQRLRLEEEAVPPAAAGSELSYEETAVDPESVEQILSKEAAVRSPVAPPESSEPARLTASDPESVEQMLQPEQAAVETPAVHLEPVSKATTAGPEPLRQLLRTEETSTAQPELVPLSATTEPAPEAQSDPVVVETATALGEAIPDLEQAPGQKELASERQIDQQTEAFSTTGSEASLAALPVAEESIPVESAGQLGFLNEALLSEPTEAATQPVEPPVETPVLAARPSVQNTKWLAPEPNVQPFDPIPQLAIPKILAPEMPPPQQAPPELLSVYNTPSRKSGIPPWVITMVAAVIITLVSASIVQKLSSGESAASAATSATAAKPKVAKTAPPAQAREAMAPVSSPEASEPETPAVPMILPAAVNDYPYARFVEVSSLKVVQQNDRPQVQYFVVNNAEMELENIALRVAVRDSKSKGSDPLFTVTAWVPKLAPHQSKEIRTDLDTGLRAGQIPNPANLRTEVRVTSQQ